MNLYQSLLPYVAKSVDWSMREYSYQLVCVLSIVSVHTNRYNPSGGMESIRLSLRFYRALMSKEGDVYNELNATLILRKKDIQGIPDLTQADPPDTQESLSLSYNRQM